MRRFLGILVLLAAVLVPLAASGGSSKWWEIWSGSAWQRLEPPYPTDSERPVWLRPNVVRCNGQLRRYVTQEGLGTGKQCLLRTTYSYYCISDGTALQTVPAPDMTTQPCPST